MATTTTSPPPEDRTSSSSSTKRMKQQQQQPTSDDPSVLPPPDLSNNNNAPYPPGAGSGVGGGGGPPPPPPSSYHPGYPPYPSYHHGPPPPQHWQQPSPHHQPPPPPHYPPSRGDWNNSYPRKIRKNPDDMLSPDGGGGGVDPYYGAGYPSPYPPSGAAMGHYPPPSAGGVSYANQGTWTGKLGGGGHRMNHHPSYSNGDDYSRLSANDMDDGASSSAGGSKEKGRGSYKCGRCGVPKKGHVCPYQPKMKRRPDEPPPEIRNAAVQVEMDEFMTIRRLNLKIQGLPESYVAEPYELLAPSSPSSDLHHQIDLPPPHHHSPSPG